MIEVTVSDQNRIHLRPHVFECTRNNCRIGADRPLERYIEKPNPRKIRIHEKRVTVRFKLVAIHAEIRYANRRL